jgi:hypothetical protein
METLEKILDLWKILFKWYYKIIILIIVLYVALIAVVAFLLIPLGLMNLFNEDAKTNDLNFVYQLIGYSLSLSGFTMLGGIFDRDKPKEIELKLFISSIGFLLTSFLFIVFMGLAMMPEKMKQADNEYAMLSSYGAVTAFGLGLLFFVAGFIFLLAALIGHATELIKTRKYLDTP